MRIVSTSRENLEFLINFEDIVKEMKNPRQYRFQIVRFKDLFECEKLNIEVKDTLTNKLYNIKINDYSVTTNPFLSKKTLRQLMSLKIGNITRNPLKYTNNFIKYLQQKITFQLKKINIMQKQNKVNYNIDEIINAMIKSLGISKIPQKTLNIENIEDLIKFVKTPMFDQKLINSEVVKIFKNDVKDIEKFEKNIYFIKNNISQKSNIQYPSFSNRLMIFLKEQQNTKIYVEEKNNK